MALGGGCRCGAVRYEIGLDEPPPVYACHCHACQRWSGAAFSQQSAVPLASLAVAGELASFVYEAPSGAQSCHHACARCFARIYNVSERLPGIALVRGGTRDDSPAIAPVLHIWASRKQPWIILPDRVPVYGESAPPADFSRILRLG